MDAPESEQAGGDVAQLGGRGCCLLVVLLGLEDGGMTMQLSASEARIMRFLKNGGCEVQDSVRASHVLLATEQGTIAASRAELEAMQKKGLLHWEEERLGGHSAAATSFG